MEGCGRVKVSSCFAAQFSNVFWHQRLSCMLLVRNSFLFPYNLSAGDYNRNTILDKYYQDFCKADVPPLAPIVARTHQCLPASQSILTACNPKGEQEENSLSTCNFRILVV